jgi:UDP-2,3-diacylglucosamine pyrophosphatase LpxH
MKKKLIKFVAYGDSHGDIICNQTADAFCEFLKAFRPDERIFLGDGVDARPWRKGADADDRKDNMREDFSSCLDFMRRTRPTAYLAGNHCDRIFRMAATDGPESTTAWTFENDLKERLRKVGCRTLLPYDRRVPAFRLGPVAFIHGFRSGKLAVKEEARTYCQSGGALIMGHLHRMETVNIEIEGGGVGISAGCIGDINKMDYAKTHGSVLTWANGWVYGVIQGNEWKAWTAHRFNGRFLYTGNFTLLGKGRE